MQDLAIKHMVTSAWFVNLLCNQICWSMVDPWMLHALGSHGFFNVFFFSSLQQSKNSWAIVLAVMMFRC
jgi:hypothetical protein